MLQALEKYLRVIAYIWAASWFLDLLKVLPPEIGDRIVEAILKKLGI